MTLRDLRKKAGLNQTQLGKLSGTSRPTISNIECGNYSPRIETMIKIGKALGVDWKEIDWGPILTQFAK